MQTVAVIDYGMSNLRSVAKAVEFVAEGGARVEILDDPDRILAADRIVFPGQGAMGRCMETLRARGLDGVLLECVRTKPFLGICLGLQTLMEYSEEDGGTRGLGVIPGRVLRFPEGRRDAGGNLFKIPHMGWNRVRQVREHPLWRGIESGERFYFVHSYYVESEDEADIAGSTGYILDFTSAAARDNLFATQFHPEKSQRCGLQLLRNFLEWL
jgi:glutamine amidotransferase